MLQDSRTRVQSSSHIFCMRRIAFIAFGIPDERRERSAGPVLPLSFFFRVFSFLSANPVWSRPKAGMVLFVQQFRT